ncbi:membrane hypothetical protein [Candidatus Terasakiella magnetica]|uniref:Uncharacterized protein n=1 Tax=Candidatus Terasakiella magnetica TaxID=1867952 RepID=A0A1C3RHH6_9PROT|nr:hypothetical protein [Candidatus Terasakiella magnetica]SCA56737.1 membrane hypothetical protein [Candidatus Terasakiella magnetica]
MSYSFLHPPARQAYKNYAALKFVMFWVFVFWLYGSLKVQPALQADKWASVSVSAALSFGIVFLTYAAAKSWLHPDRIDGPGGLGWIYSILATLVSVSDVFFVYERMEALSVNGLISTSVTTSPLFNYAVSGVLLVVNLAISVAMAAAYYRAGLHDEAIQLDLMDGQHAYEHRQEFLSLLKDKCRIFFKNQRTKWNDGRSQVEHVSQIKGDRRTSEAAQSAAKAALASAEAERISLKADEISIENELHRQANARRKASFGRTSGPVIDGDYVDVTTRDNVVPFSRIPSED